jgi:hypothetical protein
MAENLGYDELGTLSDYVSRTGTNWNTSANLQQYYAWDNEANHEPNLDEFVINIGHINASFYMYYEDGEIQTKIASQHSPHFKVTNIEVGSIPNFLFVEHTFVGFDNETHNPEMYIEPSTVMIKEITVMDAEGVTYVFGGDLETIDLSLRYVQDFSYANYYDYYGTPTSYDSNPNTPEVELNPEDFHSFFFAAASTWHIKKIILPGQETILFEYKKGNVNISEKFSRSVSTSHNSWSLPEPVSILSPWYNTASANLLHDKQYNIVYPSMLARIEASNGEVIDVVSTPRDDLRTDGFYQEQTYLLRDNYGSLIPTILNAKNYYYKIDKIQTPNDSIDFYYTNNPDQRLKLDSLRIASIGKYKFTYNSQLLPNYDNHWVSDSWGYYNGKSYQHLIDSSAGFDQLYAFRTPDATLVKAEILETIVYPTGGETRIEYELHDYSKVARQYPFTIESRNGVAGGVRVKRITMADNNDPTKNIITDYLYENENGTSSGILQVDPIYVTSGVDNSNGTNYFYKTSTYMNWVDGFHMAYSRVVELQADGSKTVYSFVNNNDVMDEASSGVYGVVTNAIRNRFTSRELDRGLIKSCKYYDSSNTLLREEQYTYHTNNTDYLKIIDRNSIGMLSLIRVSANKIYTYFPSLATQTTIQYTSMGNLTEVEEYEYNSYRLLTNKKKTISHVSGSTESYEERTQYLCDIMPLSFTGSIATALRTLVNTLEQTHQWGLPCEKVLLRNGKVVAAEVTSYKVWENDENDLVVKDRVYQLEIQDPVQDYESYSISGSYSAVIDDRCTGRTTYEAYDEYGNPVYVKAQDGKEYMYLWSYEGQYPIAEIVWDKTMTYTQVKSIVQTQLSVGDLDALSRDIQPNEVKLRDGTLQNALPNALVTTYTYQPFVGITSQTAPDGTTVCYEYDNFGRLKWTYTAVDGEYQYLTGNKYHHKNQ